MICMMLSQRKEEISDYARIELDGSLLNLMQHG